MARSAGTVCTVVPARLLVAAGAVATALVGAGLPTHGWPATVAVLLAAALVATAGLPALRRPRPGAGPGGPGSARLRRGVILWSTLVVVGLAWEAYAFVRQPDWSLPSHDQPTLSTLLDPVLEHGPLRIVGWLVWLAAGWRLLSGKMGPVTP